jgi:hypothetical protein
MKRVFHIAIDSDTYNSDGIAKGFEQNGYVVDKYNWQQQRYELHTEGMNAHCVGTAILSNPDLIFLHCQNPEAFSEETVNQLRAIAPIVHYTFDVKEDIRWHKSIAKYMAVTLFACHEDVNSCKADGIDNVAYMPSSADFDVYKPSLIMDQKKETMPPIVFIGSKYINTSLNYPKAQERQDMIDYMYENFPTKFMAFGQGQKGGLTKKEQEIEIYNRAKIVITHNNFLRKGYCSDRDFRAVGCGPLVVHQFFEGVKEMFGWHTAVWADFQDLKYTCDYFLRENKTEERERIANKDREHVLSNHTWGERVKQILKLLPEVTTK